MTPGRVDYEAVLRFLQDHRLGFRGGAACEVQIGSARARPSRVSNERSYRLSSSWKYSRRARVTSAAAAPFLGRCCATRRRYASAASSGRRRPGTSVESSLPESAADAHGNEDIRSAGHSPPSAPDAAFWHGMENRPYPRHVAVPEALRPAVREQLDRLVAGDLPDLLTWVRRYGRKGAAVFTSLFKSWVVDVVAADPTIVRLSYWQCYR